jgi:hypothetical protein
VLPLMTRQTAGAVDFVGMEPKQISDGIDEDVRHSLREDDAVDRSYRVARRTLDSSPTWHANHKMVRSRQPTGALRGVVVR